MTMEEFGRLLADRGIEKFSVTTPVCTRHGLPPLPTEKNQWRVCIKKNDMQLDWTYSKWRGSFEAALKDIFGDLPQSKPAPKPAAPAADLTDLLV